MATTTRSFGYPVQPDLAAGHAVYLVGRPDPVILTGDVRVVMLVNKTGLRYGQAWPKLGEEITVPAEEAARLIRANSATLAPNPEPAPEAEPEEEQATVAEEPAEQAVIRRPTKRRSPSNG